MTRSETALPSFDILSYPKSASIEHILVDLPETVPTPEHPSVRRLGRVAGTHEIVAHGQSDIDPNHTMLISNDRQVTETVLHAGMGAIHLANATPASEPLRLLLHPTDITDQPLYEHPLYTTLSHQEVAEALYQSGRIHVVGFVGRTGAGKSTAIRDLIPTLENSGGHGALFEIDSFFVRSRTARKAWLNEEGISDEERAERQSVLTWWDLDKAIGTLQEIKKGNHVKLDGLYDMQQGGEMVGTLDIAPNEEGFTVFVEGTALLVPEFRVAIDAFVYINTHDHIRTANLRSRNTRDGYTPEESAARKMLTDAAETNEHLAKQLRKERFSLGSLTVLDNSHTDNTLRLMPPYIPRI